MAGACPAPGPDDPLVRSLLGTVDCNVQDLVQTGYATLFQPSGVFVTAITAILTIYVALFGYRLMLGRAQLNVSDLALTAVKLGVVLALATQWGAYQAIVYRTLFFAPQQLADIMLHGLRAHGSALDGNVFDGLQRAFTDLTSFSPAQPPGGPLTAQTTGPNGAPASGGVLSTLLSKAGFDSMLMLISAVILLLSSLGVLLACKVVLGLLLAIGPIFIALLLFDSTRGLFEGWLRASLGFALAPLAVTLLLGLALNLLEPSLQQIEVMRQVNSYTPGVAFGAIVLVVVFAGVSLGLVAAGAVIAGGFRLPRPDRGSQSSGAPTVSPTPLYADPAAQPRATRTAAAMAAQERRDAAIFAGAAASPIIAPVADQRTPMAFSASARDVQGPTAEPRLGQSRRNASPRAARSGTRQDVGGGSQPKFQEGATPR
jgi:type IV secretion system protein VirB6